MKKHQDFRRACLMSTYFIPNGRESLQAVFDRYQPVPFKQPALYKHMERHQKMDIDRSEALNKISGTESAVWQRTAGNRGAKNQIGLKKEDKETLVNTADVIEAPVPVGQKYEIGLDEFIEVGRAKLRIGDMNISAANYISAIKVKADIERTTKDRRLEMLRSMFAGAAPGSSTSGAPAIKENNE